MTVPTPVFLSPMLVSRGPLPHGPGWAYEVKWDGIRGQVALREGAVTVRSRPGRDCSESFPELAETPPALAGRSAVLNGEIVCLETDGYPDFAAVRARLVGARVARRTHVAFMAFDVLSLDGEPATELPTASAVSCSRASDSRDRSGGCRRRSTSRLRWLAATRDHGLEGVVAKRLDSRYTPGERSAAWIKPLCEVSDKCFYLKSRVI